MPLTPLQRKVVETLRPFRSHENFVGGGAALNDRWPRLSDDMDIFHDMRHRLPDEVAAELDALRKAGFGVEISVETEWTVEVIARRFGEETRIQWMDEPETSKRFFPAVDDETFGFRLHQADLAVNKVLCASRREDAPRDAVDLLSISERYCPLGPLVWAAAGKDSDATPPTVIREIRRIALGYADEEIRAVRMEDQQEVGRAQLREALDTALDRALTYCNSVPPDEHYGHLFVDRNKIPIEADENAIAEGRAEAVPIRDYSSVPRLKE